MTETPEELGDDDGGAPLTRIAAAVQAERRRAGLSLSELARRVGRSKSTLSLLESASGNPSVETLWAIAAALEIPFARLVEAPAPEPRIVRAGERPEVRAEHADFAASLLSGGRGDARRDLYVVTLEPGELRDAEPHPRGALEHVVVGAGRVRLGRTEEPVELGPGDYAMFPGDAPHRYEALTAGAWFVLVMEHPA